MSNVSQLFPLGGEKRPHIRNRLENRITITRKRYRQLLTHVDARSDLAINVKVLRLELETLKGMSLFDRIFRWNY